MRIIITGTPGTGKTSVAKALAKKLGVAYVDVKKIIGQKKVFYREKGESEKTVYLKKLKVVLEKILAKEKKAVLESHLLCEFPLKVGVVVVLRCDPRVLESRLRKRRYPKRKIRENLLCEALDYCTVKAEENYRKVIDVDATKRLSAAKLEEKIKRCKGDEVNWSGWLEKNA